MDSLKPGRKASPMRICLVSKEYPPAGTGGIANYVYDLAHGLAAAGQDVTVIAGAAREDNRREREERKRLPDGATSAPLTSGGLPVRTSGDNKNAVNLHRVHDHRFPLPAFTRRRGRAIRTLLERSWAVDRSIARLERKQGSFDIVEMSNWNAEGIIYSLHRRAPLVIRLSTPLALIDQLSDNPSTRLGYLLHCYLESFSARRADCIIAHSRYIANYCANLYRCPAAAMYVIPLGIKAPPAPPANSVAAVPSSSGLRRKSTSKADNGAVTILYVGRLESRKGIHHLLQAIPKVAARLPHSKFLIAGIDTGDGPHGMTYRDYLASYATPAVRRATTFLGYVGETALADTYASCDIFVAPSLSESFGLVYVEAMARAKPVVAFRTGAAPEVIADGKTGILVEPDNTDELANALIRLAQDVELRKEMGRRSYDRVQTSFSLQRMIDATVACYRRVIAQAETSPRPIRSC